jgi:hypothetical protein
MLSSQSSQPDQSRNNDGPDYFLKTMKLTHKNFNSKRGTFRPSTSKVPSNNRNQSPSLLPIGIDSSTNEPIQLLITKKKNAPTSDHIHIKRIRVKRLQSAKSSNFPSSHQVPALPFKEAELEAMNTDLQTVFMVKKDVGKAKKSR